MDESSPLNHPAVILKELKDPRAQRSLSASAAGRLWDRAKSDADISPVT